MAIDPSTEYPGQIDTDAGYPYGKARNRSAPGSTDGTPLEQRWLNDVFGFFQALLDQDDTVPSGTPDTIAASQYMTALRRLKDGGNFQVLSGAAITIGAGGKIDIAATGEIDSYGTITIEATAYEYVDGTLGIRDGGFLNLASGSKLDAYGGSYITIKTGGHLNQDAGGLASLSGATTVTATGSITFEEDGTLTFSGTGDYPKTPGHFKWLPTRGSTAVASPSSWLHDGAGFIANSASQLRLFHHFGVPGHLTLTDLEVYWEGPEHETWPPENRTYFTLFKLDGTTGGLTQIATVADTNEQGTYEGAHQLTVATGKSVVCATNESLVLWMVTESGTNAEAGSKFLDTKMRCTFEELIGV